MNPKNFFAELQRRNVYKVAVAYGVIGWLLVQVATQVFPFFDVPVWVVRLVVIGLVLGFPLAVVLAWIFELTPEGLKRTDEIPPSQSIGRHTGRKLGLIIIGVLLAIIAVMAFQRYGSGLRPAERMPQKSIAVLPFADLSAAQDQEYFSDGLMEQIINGLGRVGDLSVVARTSALAFRRKEVDIREVGRVLGVNHVLEGSVRRGLGMVRIDARLINVATGYQLWSETYDSSESDFLVLQSEVAQKVVLGLRKELRLGNDEQRVEVPPNPEAYDLYLRGQYLLNKRTVESIRGALALFQQAVAKDARFALGHAGAADAFILLAKVGALPGEEAASRAWPEVTSALRLDPDLTSGYVARGLLLTDFQWNWTAAEKDFQKALALDPNSAAAHHGYARYLAQVGRSEEAMREIDAALKTDPLAPTLWVTRSKILFMAHCYEEAVGPCLKALALEPNFAYAYQSLGQAYTQLNEPKKAVDAMQKYVELSGSNGWSLLELAYTYAVTGNRARSERIVEETMSRATEYSPYDMATIHSAWHDNPEAMQWLRLAIDRRSVDVIWIRVDPRLDNVRSDPYFHDIVQTMDLPRQVP